MYVYVYIYIYIYIYIHTLRSHGTAGAGSEGDARDPGGIGTAVLGAVFVGTDFPQRRYKLYLYVDKILELCFYPLSNISRVLTDIC